MLVVTFSISFVLFWVASRMRLPIEEMRRAVA
jgi:hypothetical protein